MTFTTYNSCQIEYRQNDLEEKLGIFYDIRYTEKFILITSKKALTNLIE